MIAPATNPALAALRHHVSGAIARGEAEPVRAIPPTVDTVHGRSCICHRCAPVPAPVWIKRGARDGIAAIFNQESKP